MSELSIQTLLHNLPESYRHIIIAYSGGLDSHVLLHLFASQSSIKEKLTGVYIHHGLQVQADDWGEHCRQQCLSLGVDFKLIKVNAMAKAGESPEAAARSARYSALRALLEPGDVLCLAQHCEDQMETVLLQLLRGSGIQGLAAMPDSTVFGRGTMVRPLLGVAKADIQQYAARHALCWIEDPSNLCDDFDRNFLRNQVVPLLKQRWPSLDKTIARSARHCSDAAQLLNDWARSVLAVIVDPFDRSLSINDWPKYNQRQGDWLLRQWLQMSGLKPPSQAALKNIVEQLILGKSTNNAQIFLQGCYLKKYREKLFCIPGAYFHSEPAPRHWNLLDDALLMVNGYKLSRIESSAGIDKRLWDTQAVTVDSRRGGEQIKLPGRSGRHCLKKLYQEAGIPPWDRELRPLVFLNGRLAAVAGLWVAEWAYSERPKGCYRLLWQP